MVYHGNKNPPGYLLVIILILLSFFIISGIRDRQDYRQIVTESRFMMDIRVVIKIPVETGNSDRVKTIINDTFDKMQRLADKLDRFQKSSIVSKINNSQGRPVRVEKQIYNLLVGIKEYAELSEGGFDPTIAPLIDSWGFGTDKKQVPSPEIIKKLLGKVNYKKIKTGNNDGIFNVSLPAGMAIDLGAVAKGYIVDKGIEYLQQQGFDAAYINAGGNIRVTGSKAGNKPWQIGIKNPRGEGVLPGYIFQLREGSLATSGDYQRYFIQEGVRYSHLLDARTGYPAREMYSATIYADTAFKADVLSTIVFITGWERGREIINKISGAEAILVRNGEKWASNGIRKLVK